LLSKYFHQAMRSLKVTLSLFPLTSGVKIIVTVGLLYIGFFKVQQKALSIGALLVFIQYLGRFYSPFVNIARFYNSIAMSIVSYKRLSNTLLDTERYRDITVTNIIPKAHNVELEQLPVLEFNEVSFGYDSPASRANIIESLCFEVMRGEKVAIVGESGKGKTTVLNLIVRLI